MKARITIILAAALALGAASCGAGGGSLTITGIPAQYNGMYLYYTAEFNVSAADRVGLLGCDKLNVNDGSIITCAKINNGKARLKLWTTPNIFRDHNFTAFSGSGNSMAGNVYITSTDIVTDDNYDDVQVARFNSNALIEYTNGKATVSWTALAAGS